MGFLKQNKQKQKVLVKIFKKETKILSNYPTQHHTKRDKTAGLL